MNRLSGAESLSPLRLQHFCRAVVTHSVKLKNLPLFCLEGERGGRVRNCTSLCLWVYAVPMVLVGLGSLGVWAVAVGRFGLLRFGVAAFRGGRTGPSPARATGIHQSSFPATHSHHRGRRTARRRGRRSATRRSSDCRLRSRLSRLRRIRLRESQSASQCKDTGPQCKFFHRSTSRQHVSNLQALARILWLQ